MTVSPHSVGQVALPVQDVARATEFYRDRLGLEFLFSAPPGLSFFQCGEVRLMISERREGDGEEPGVGAPLLYYRVEDIHAAHGELDDAGVDVIRAPEVTHRDERMELWIAFYRDSEENLFALMDERGGA
jgi:methylmalonyl-CoA/ethylmalonyl-CoA epimerase